MAKGLGVVFEGVGWRVFALIRHSQLVGVFYEHEIGVRARMLNGARKDVSGNAQVARVGLRTHGLQFLDGDIVAFIRAQAADSQIGDCRQHDHNRNADPPTLIFALHKGWYKFRPGSLKDANRCSSGVSRISIVGADIFAFRVNL